MDSSLKICYAITTISLGGIGQAAIAQEVSPLESQPQPQAVSVKTYTVPTIASPSIALPEQIATQPESSPSPLPPAKPPGIKLESLTTDVQNESDPTRTNRIIEPQAQLRLPNGDQLQVKTGWDTFQQTGVETIQNLPLQATWVKKVGGNNLKLGGGVDVFNRLPIQPKLHAEYEVPLGVETSPQNTMNRGVVLKAAADYGAYKFNAKTLEQGINVLRVKPQVYWQIDPKTSFYSHYQLGLYNDNNVEHQTYSRLERKLGQFFVAANLFSWNYKADRELTHGYFSPKQFLTYSGEVGWAGNVTKGLNCRVTAALGQQSLNSRSSNISQYNAGCGVAITPNISLNLGYGLSNERKQNISSSNYQNHAFTSQLQVTF